jgi:selenocysteine lyase/cysteine desulfurase
MPVAEKWAYFDHAAVSPLPVAAHQAIQKWALESLHEGDNAWPAWSEGVERTRTLGARLMGADAAEIALVKSTTEGISLIAEGFPWNEGDNVITLDNEFPSNIYPWMNLATRGVETRLAKTDGGRVSLDHIARLCDRRTRIISASWVGYISGWRIDPGELAHLAHDHGALFFLDAIQGLGAFPLAAREWGIDFASADGHKWMLGPEGAGLLFVRREHLDRLRPLEVGWHSVRHSHDYGRIELDLRDTAARYEGGTQNMAGFLGLAGSLETLLSLGVENIAQRIEGITDQACQRLVAAGATIDSPREEGHKSGIVSFTVPGTDSKQARAHAAKQGVVLASRGGRIRISPHAYVNDSDIDRLVAFVESFPSASTGNSR